MPVHMVPAVPGGTASERRPANRTDPLPDDQNAQESNAEQFDLHPRAAITKGEHNQFFMIFSQSQREVAFYLEWEAIACIWGGPVLALLSLYVLIVSWAWS